LDKITEGLSSSIAVTFACGLIPAVLAVIAAIAMSKEKLDPATAPAADEAEGYPAHSH
jgi:hypothetical protein